jgi:hypothetical protein
MSPIVSELAPVSIAAQSSTVTVRNFRMELNDVTVELSSLGAAVTKALLPNYKNTNLERDDVVVVSLATKLFWKL